MEQQQPSKDDPIYQRTVVEHGDPREVVNDIDRTIGQARAQRVVVFE